jgi:hypothetical protein
MAADSGLNRAVDIGLRWSTLAWRTPMSDRPRQVYFSYKWGGDSERIVNEIDAALKAKGIDSVRDKAALGYKGMIGDFMRAIGRGQAIVVVISDQYLTSDNTMFELVEIAKNKDVHQRIFPVILPDADIYQPVNRIKYVKHWEDKKKELNKALRTLDDNANLQGLREEIDNYDAIRDHIAALTSLLKDMNALTPEMHENSRFSSLIEALEKTLNDVNDAPVSAAQRASVQTPVAADDPWGPDAEDAFRVFLATPDQDRERLHAQLSKSLKALDGVRVIDSVPLDDQTHAQVAGDLIRAADLCIHVLGANPGRRLDVDDGQPLRTYPLEQLELSRLAARAQLVVMTQQDRTSIANEQYAERLDELESMPRDDRARFELLIAEDKNRIPGLLNEKVEKLKNQRLAASQIVSGGRGRTAFVDSHVSDEVLAAELFAFLESRNVDTDIRTSSSRTNDFTNLDETVKKSSLYIIVAGSVDREWVSSRKVAILKSAMRTKAALLIAKYSAIPLAGSDTMEITPSRFEISALKDADSTWVHALFTPAASNT